MSHPSSAVRWFLCAALTIPSISALAIPDHITVPVTNQWTGQAATLSLDRYSLRGTNFAVRIYSSPTNYTLLTPSQIPEVTTFRGRILEDAAAHVMAGIRPNGNMFYSVAYGCRDTYQEWGPGQTDPYEGTNRFGWQANIQTAYTPSLGWSYTLTTNMPLLVSGPAVGSWYNNLGATTNFGGPPPFNNFWKMATLRAKIILDVANDVYAGNYGGDQNAAILGVESCINVVDFLHARDAGSCYEIGCIDIRAYAGGAPAYDNPFVPNQRLTITLNVGGGWAQCPGWVSTTDPEDMGGVVHGHEMGHNLGMLDYYGGVDYAGRSQHTSHTGSGQGHGVSECTEAIGTEANYWHQYEEWVLYRSPLPPHAMPDYISTLVSSPATVDVLLNDRDPNSTNRANLGVSSFEPVSQQGGAVVNLGSGLLQYTPPAGFRGDDLFHYYVTNTSGMSSLMGVRVLVLDTNNPLIAQYRLDETNGTVAADSSGCGRSGTYSSVTFPSASVPGVGGGRALHLAGGGVTFSATNNAPYSYDSMDRSQSISLWFKPDATPAASQIIYGKTEILSGGAGLWIGLNNNNIFVQGRTYGPINNFSVYAPVTPMAGAWYHLVAEIDRAANQVRLWVNGVEYTSTWDTRNISAGEFVIGDHSAFIGSGSFVPGGWGAYIGALQDFRVYTKALSPTEINALYAGGGLLAAGGPTPANGAVNVDVQSRLTWVPGRTTYQHDVYWGTSSNAVALATTNSPEYKGRFTTNSYTAPAPWYAGSTYYWRVDEVDSGTNYVTGQVWGFTANFIVGVAQPYFKVLTSEQLAARTPVLLDVVGGNYYDPLTLIGCDATTAKGGAVTITNNQLRYVPPGVFSGLDTFTYTATDVMGTNSSALVTIYPITEPHYIWDPNGAAAGTGGTGTWDTSSFVWDDGTHNWPASGTNFAMFQETNGSVSIVGSGVTANGLYFGTDGYLIVPQVDNATLTLNGPSPVIIVDPGNGTTINSVLAGPSSLTKLGAGTLTLGGANNYTNAILSQGTLVANHASALGAPSGTLTLGDANTSGGSLGLKVDDGVASAVTLATLNTTTNASANTITLNAGSALGVNASELSIGTLNLNGSAPVTVKAMNTGGHGTAQDIVYRLAGGGIAPGTTALFLDGTAAALRTSFPNNSPANSFTGDVVINGAVSTQGRTYLNQNATNQNLGFLNNNVTVSSNATWTIVWGGETCGALNGSGNVTLNNQNALNNIGLTIGNNGAAGNYSGIISGGFGVLKTGAATQTFSGANTYTGTTTISQGTLSLNAAAAIPATANVVLGDAASGGASPTLNIAVNGDYSLGTLTVGANVANAALKANPGGATGFLTFNTITLNSALKLCAGTSTGNGWEGFQASGGKITGSGAGPGNDTLILTNAGGNQAYFQANNLTNDFLGNVHITGGTWRLQGSGGNNLVFPDTASLTLEGSAILGINSSGYSESIDGLNGAGSLLQTYGTPGVFTIGASGGDGNFSGVISSGLAIAKIGGGTQTFSGANTYSGGTTLSGGQLNLNHASAIGTGALTISDVSALDNTSAADVTLTSNNAQNWNADFTYVGTRSLNLGVGAVTLGADRVVTVSSNTLAVGGAISGGFGLTKAGAGMLTLGGASGYSGATVINGGTLNLSGALTVSPTITVNSTGSLNGNGTYAGAVTANTASTVAALNNALFTLGSLSLGTTGTDATTLNVIGNGSSIAGRFAVSSSGGFVVNGTCTVNIYGALPLTVPSTNVVLSYAGPRGGAGSLVLGALPGRSSGYLVDTGSQIQLIVTNYTPLNLRWSGTPASNWDLSGALVWNNISGGAPAAFYNGDSVAFDDTAANFAVNLPGTVTPGSMTVSAAANYTFSGPGGIGGAGSLMKKGSGTLTLATVNAFSGGTTISNGTVAFASGGLGSGAVTLAGSSTVRWIGNNSAGLPLALANGVTATLDVTSNNVTQSSALSGTGTALLKSGAGALTLSAANTFTGPATISQGTLSLNNAAALPTTATVLLGDANSGSGTPILQATFNATLSAMTVATNVTNATVYLTPNANNFVTVTNLALNSPLKLSKGNAGGTWVGFQDAAGGKITGPGAGAGRDSLIFTNAGGTQGYFQHNSTQANDFVGNVRFNYGNGVDWRLQAGSPTVAANNLLFPDAALLTLDSGAYVAWTTSAFTETVDGLAGLGTIYGNNGGTVNLTLNAANTANDGRRVFAGTLNTAVIALTKSGAGKQTLAGSGITYTGPTTVNGGVLSLSNATSFASSAITVTSPGVLDLDGTWTFGKGVSGTGGLSKSGTGTVTLTNAQTYTGPTTLNAGALLVNGALGTNGVVVGSNATLGGVGTIGGIVAVQNGGTISPGANGIGTLTLNAAPSLAGTTWMEISKGASPNADQLVVVGQSLTYGGTLTVANIGANPLALGDSFTLFNASGYGGTFTATNLPPLSSGLRWAWTPANGTLSVVNAVATNPTNITFSVSGGALALSWPADHLGWYLQCQTNSLSVGLNNNWVTVPGSQSMTSTNIPINPAQPAVFYRLSSP
jgi:autotransporter-associated beta strand protein